MPSSSHDLLVAEVEAFPLVSVAAFRASTVKLGRRDGAEDAATEALGRSLEERLRPHANGLSLDVLRQIRTRAWFSDPTSGHVERSLEISLHAHLLRISREYLELKGRRAVLSRRYPGDPADGDLDGLLVRSMRFRWLTLRLPADLLICALATAEGVEPSLPFVDMSTPHLARLLERGVADTHLHLGQGTCFGDVWRSLMIQLASGYESDVLALDTREGAPEFADGAGAGLAERYRVGLVFAAYLRLRLAEYLSSLHSSFEEFETGFANEVAKKLLWPAAREIARAAHRAIRSLDLAPSFVLLRKLYRKLVYAKQPPRRPLMATLRKKNDAIFTMDPVLPWLGGTDGEMSLLRRGLGYLAKNHDASFAVAFWQYVRLRNMTYSFVTQDPGVGGLDWFQRFSRRLGPIRRPLDRNLVTSAHALQSCDVRLDALEVRETPRTDWAVAWKSIREMADQLVELRPDVGGERPEAGVVLHFVKDRDRHHEPNGATWAYGRWYRNQWKAARSTAFLFEKFPETLLLIRGIDVASAELSVPLWPILPPIFELRRASRRAAERLGHRRPDWNVEPLRFTCHAGEDFRRLAEGIRRVHELVRYGALDAGDRIGHGLAVGVDPERWAASARCIAQPQAERLEDLLWELDLYGRGSVAPIAARVERTRAEIGKLAGRLYGEAISVETLLAARHRRHDPRRLTALGFPAAVDPPEPNDAFDRFLLRHLRDPHVFRRGTVPVEVATEEGEVAFLRAAQDFVRRELARLEVTIETNPSSNLLIGHFESVDEHPVFRMFPRRGHERSGETTVLVSLNVDDPVAFASRMADEYAHVYYALLRAGVPAREALDWLDRVRSNGLDSRFSLRASRSEAALAVVSGRRARRG